MKIHQKLLVCCDTQKLQAGHQTQICTTFQTIKSARIMDFLIRWCKDQGPPMDIPPQHSSYSMQWLVFDGEMSVSKSWTKFLFFVKIGSGILNQAEVRLSLILNYIYDHI